MDEKKEFLKYLSIIYEVTATMFRKISVITENVVDRDGALKKWSATIDKRKFAESAIMMAESLGYADHIDFEQFKRYLSQYIKEDEKYV